MVLMKAIRAENKNALKAIVSAAKEEHRMQELNERLAFIEARLVGVELVLDDDAKV